MISGVSSNPMAMMQMMRPPNYVQGGDPTENVNTLIQHRDADGNGSLSADEIGIPKEFFNRLDTDGNGEASFQELSDMHSKMQQGPPPMMMQMMMGGSSSANLIDQLYGSDSSSESDDDTEHDPYAYEEYESIDVAA